MQLTPWRLTDDDYYGIAAGIFGLAVAFALSQGCRAPADPPQSNVVAPLPADPTPTVALPLALSPADAPLPATLSAIWYLNAL